MPYGVIAPIDQQPTALAAGADYLEPTVVGTLVEDDGAGSWRAVPAYAPFHAPISAILDPAF